MNQNWIIIAFILVALIEATQFALLVILDRQVKQLTERLDLPKGSPKSRKKIRPSKK